MKVIKKTTKFRIWHFLMAKALVQFALSVENLVITNSIASYKSLIGKVKAKVDLLIELYAKKSVSLRSYSKQKTQLRESICIAGSTMFNAVYNFAIDKNMSELAENMNYSRNQLSRLSYTDLVAFIQQRIDTITPLVPSLADYDVTTAQVSALQNQITDLNNILPETFYAARKALNIQIQQTLNETMQLVYDTDRQALSFQSKEKTYYDTYLAIRKLKPYTKHTKYRVLVTDDLKQKGIINVTVQQNGTSNKAVTDINGNATLYIEVSETKDQQKVYEFTLTNGSQTINTGSIEIKQGHTVSQTFTMKETGFIIPSAASAPIESENELVIK